MILQDGDFEFFVFFNGKSNMGLCNFFYFQELKIV